MYLVQKYRWSSTRALRWNDRAEMHRGPDSLKRRGLLASLVGRSWSVEGEQDAAKLLGGLLELKTNVSGLHCSKGGKVGEREVSSTSLSSPLDSSAKQFNM